MSKKKIAILIIVLIVLAGLVVYFFMPRMDNEKSDWQTYRNENYGFEFKYPGAWYLEEGSSNKYWVLTNYKPPHIGYGPYNNEQIKIEIDILSQERSKIDTIDYDAVDIVTEMVDKKEIISNGIIFERKEINNNSFQYKHIVYSALRNNNEFVFQSTTELDSSRNKYLIELFDQILSTFKFLD